MERESLIPARDQHQARIDHATWIMRRKAAHRCSCLTCWAAYLDGRESRLDPVRLS